MKEFINEIARLKNIKDALILAHYYQPKEIKEIADHVCDSFEMACRAREAESSLLVICGVRFMAETAKIMNPKKCVLLPAPRAGCPMADMVTIEDITALKKQHPDAAVVCYVNSSAEVKAVSDICCTSSSAEKIVRALPEKKIIFVPDRNLGAYVASKVPEKEIILFDGYCPVHDRINEADALAAKKAHPKASLLVHPECRGEVLVHADYIGSTAGIISHAIESQNSEFIIGTEYGVAEHLAELAPKKKFYMLRDGFLCPDMKKIQLSDVQFSLERGKYEIDMYSEELFDAREALERMVELGQSE